MSSADDEHDRSAGVPPAVAGASRPRFGAVTIRDRGRLPHWEYESGTYFVTFRLADSLPAQVVKKLDAELELISNRISDKTQPLTIYESRRLKLLHTFKIEKYLDAGSGICHLREPHVAEAVANALRHFDGKKYSLIAWCVMPNHVHVAFKIFPSGELAKIVHSWKSFTAKSANNLLGLSGTFWEREYYDHLVRDQEELGRVIRYVARNPEKARLKDWPWVQVCGQDARTTAGETPALR
jgi:REP element-mobilizing transposase RayT